MKLKSLVVIALGAALPIGLVSVRASEGRPEAGGKVDFNRDVRPILARNCFACHGQDEAKRAKGLRLDRRDSAVNPLKNGDIAIVPGDSESSELILRVTEETDTLRMPPRKAGGRLTPAEIDVLRRWIAQGAEYAPHWGFVAPKARPIPRISDRAWPRNGIDFWILERLQREGLKPSVDASRAMLLRRVSLDLRGLPHTLEEVEQFVAERSPDAYEKAVDQFLADSAYGERWARIWLDQARYADSAGYGSDPLRPTIWRYRDWVLSALNRNQPFDQFTIWQIAGDLLPGSTLEQKIATAFHRNTMTNTEGGTDDEEFRVAAIKDRVDTTMQVFMGLTMGCAKCHSHKFDPITHEDYYKFYALFNQTADNDQPDESPVLAAPSENSRPAIPKLPVMVELPKAKRRVSRILRKGNHLDPGAVVVDPGVPASLHSLPPEAPHDRLGLARWLVDPQNPLTARVAVNRLWAQIFAVGLVETEEDFGTQGEPPSHPELLDWLAISYTNSGWDTKKLLRLIVTSSTYRPVDRRPPHLAPFWSETRETGCSGVPPECGSRPRWCAIRRWPFPVSSPASSVAPAFFRPSRMGYGKRRLTASAPGRPARERIAIGAGSIHFGGGLFPILRWPPSTPPAARSVRSSGCGRIRLSSRSSP